MRMAAWSMSMLVPSRYVIQSLPESSDELTYLRMPWNLAFVMRSMNILNSGATMTLRATAVPLRLQPAMALLHPPRSWSLPSTPTLILRTAEAVVSRAMMMSECLVLGFYLMIKRFGCTEELAYGWLLLWLHWRARLYIFVFGVHTWRELHLETKGSLGWHKSILAEAMWCLCLDCTLIDKQWRFVEYDWGLFCGGMICDWIYS